MSEGEQRADRSKVGGIRIRVLNAVMIVLAGALAFMFLSAVRQTSAAYNEFVDATERYITCEQAANSMKAGSNYLTTQIRQFVVSHDEVYLNNYCIEAYATQRREKAVQQLEAYLSGKPAHKYLEQAIQRSNELMYTEYYAAKLVLQVTGGDAGMASEALDGIEIEEKDAALSNNEKLDRAMDLVFGVGYQDDVNAIERNVSLCKDSLIAEIDKEKDENAAVVNRLLSVQEALTWALVAVVVIIILSIVILILRPINKYVDRIGENRALPLSGANELRIMAEEYNVLYEENLKHSDDLRRKAEHDHLTGLYNREVFERLLHAYRENETALFIVDADYFKEVNDTYGHDGGDKILQKVAAALTSTFRATDHPCRIGGDEFAVIMTDVNSGLTPTVAAKAQRLAEYMADTSDGLPAMTLSIGIAFNNGSLDPDALFKRADTALYHVKERGRNGFGIYKESAEGPSS